MTPTEVARLRLAAQRVTGKGFRRPAEVVAWLGAVQAQDYLGSLWAVGLRMERASEADVEKAIAARSIVRTWPMRGTLHFLAAADARWIVDLLAPRRISSAAARFRQLGLDDAIIARSRRALEKHLGEPMSRPRVYEVLERAGIAAKEQRGLHILWRLAHESFLCFGPREGKQPTFVLLDAWIPPAKARPRDEALAELALRYFRGHGPGTVVDLAWWSGLPQKDVQRAIAAAGRGLRRESVGETEVWVDARAKLPAKGDAGTVLLPAFDELLVAFSDRSALLDPRLARRVNAGGGILRPVIVQGEQVVGTWQRRFARRGVRFEPSPFRRLDARSTAAARAAFERYARFLDLTPHP